MTQTAKANLAPVSPAEGPAGGETAVTWEQVESYLDSLSSRGRTAGTITAYRRSLKRFYRDLPEDKRVDRETISRWRTALLEGGYTARTVNAHLSAANSLMDYLGMRGYQHSQYLPLPEDEEQPELTRNEYLRLLSAARLLERERTYLLVKVFALTGLTVGELSQLTVEAVREGVLRPDQDAPPVPIPDGLREELLHYILQRGVLSGPVFVTRTGKNMYRTTVTACIQGLARDAQVSPEKCNPRCLHKLYLATQEEIRGTFLPLIQQAYQRLLETEQMAIGWAAGEEDED